MKNSKKLKGGKKSSPLIFSINELVESEKHVLLFLNKKNVYWLFKHYRYLKPVKQARKILLGKNLDVLPFVNQLLYLTEPL